MTAAISFTSGELAYLADSSPNTNRSIERLLNLCPVRLRQHGPSDDLGMLGLTRGLRRAEKISDESAKHLVLLAQALA